MVVVVEVVVEEEACAAGTRGRTAAVNGRGSR